MFFSFFASFPGSLSQRWYMIWQCGPTVFVCFQFVGLRSSSFPLLFYILFSFQRLPVSLCLYLFSWLFLFPPSVFDCCFHKFMISVGFFASIAACIFDKSLSLQLLYCSQFGLCMILSGSSIISLTWVCSFWRSAEGQIIAFRIAGSRACSRNQCRDRASRSMIIFTSKPTKRIALCQGNPRFTFILPVRHCQMYLRQCGVFVFFCLSFTIHPVLEAEKYWYLIPFQIDDISASHSQW